MWFTVRGLGFALCRGAEMDHLLWDKSFECGHPAVDRQHRFLFESAQEIRKQFGTINRRVLSLLAKSLIDYCQYHFETEERVMAVVCPDALSAHRAEHALLRAHLDELWSHRLQLTPEELFEVLADWIVGHVLGADQDLKEAATA